MQTSLPWWLQLVASEASITASLLWGQGDEAPEGTTNLLSPGTGPRRGIAAVG